MRTGTVVIGAGQAGIALSFHLTARGHDHVVLERGRVGERWHSERWESLTLLTPNRLNRLPGQPPAGDPDGFASRLAFVQGLDAHARSFGAPVVEHAAVHGVEQRAGGFHVRSERGTWHATNVVVATGDCDRPRVPAVARDVPDGVGHLHASAYRRPDLLPRGGVLVVGAGPSGQQLARELTLAGRRVVLAAGRHARAPLRHRGRDIWHWLCEIGDLHRSIDEVEDPVAARRTPSIPLSGACGGIEIDLGILTRLGVTVAGRLARFDHRTACFGDLAAEVAAADRRLARVLANIDAHIARHDLPAPPAPPFHSLDLPPGPAAIDLRRRGIRTVLWATGYGRSYGWLRVPGAIGADGELVQQHGITPVRGLYTLGLKFQRRRSSHIIGGVGRDAEELADEIVARPAVATAGSRGPRRGRRSSSRSRAGCP